MIDIIFIFWYNYLWITVRQIRSARWGRRISMNNVTFNKKGTIKYLIWTFLIAWLAQVIIAVFSRIGLAAAGQILMTAMMFAPLLGVLLSGQKLTGMGWKPRLKGKVRFVLAAWFIPTVLTAVGAAIYFAVFPGHFDLSGAYIAENGGAEALEQLEAQGITYPVYVLITIVGCLTYLPLINMLAAIGEEAGWRGFLYPQLKARFGKGKGWLIGGVIWGAWHWPVMCLTGYEYGTDYVGFPIVGMLLFCVIVTAWGILCDWLYEKTGCIWVPSVFHGAINASATVPLAVCIPSTGSGILAGPAPHGILAGLPMLLCAVILLFGAVREKKAE